MVMRTDFPYSEMVELEITGIQPQGLTRTAGFTIHIRAPSWLSQPLLSIKVNGKAAATTPRGSYASLHNPAWKQGDLISFTLSLALEAKMYTGASQVDGYDRYSFKYGPL